MRLLFRHPNYYKKILLFFSPSIRMSRKTIIFYGKKIKKNFFKIDNVDVYKILLSKKERYGTNKPIKYFIGCYDNDDIRPLCIILPQMIGYVSTLISSRESAVTLTSYLK